MAHHRRLYPAIAAVVSVLGAAIIACSPGKGGGAEKSVVGVVSDVASVSVTEFDSLTVVDASGHQWKFTALGFAGMTPSHLAEHRALGEPVRVWYLERGADLIAVRIEDG